jgi:hypothetical protein
MLVNQQLGGVVDVGVGGQFPLAIPATLSPTCSGSASAS